MSFLFLLIVTWLSLFFLDIILKVSLIHLLSPSHDTCLFPLSLPLQRYCCESYGRLLLTTGLTIKPFQVRFFTTRFNSSFWNLSRKWRHYFEVHFKLGVIVSFILLPISITILVQSLYYDYYASGDNSVPTPTLQPILPGVNIPMSDIGLYLMSIFIASVIHEAGHALAAYSTGSSMEGIGLTVFAIVPVAFVELATDVFAAHPPFKKLQIVCAGVWHNVLLAVFAATLLLARPLLLYPMCSHGVSIASSKLDGNGGLFAGDSILSLNNCTISDRYTWRQCFIQTISSPQIGYCIEDTFLQEEQLVDSNDCCRESIIERRNLCFISDRENNTLCLPVRKVLNVYEKSCHRHSDCLDDKVQCIKPIAESNRTKLIQMKRRYDKDYIYWGFAGDIFTSVTIVECTTSWITILSLVYWSENLLRYLVSFSLALGVMNIIPCFHLDGFWIVSAALELKLFRLSNELQAKIIRSVCAIGSLLLLLALFRGFYGLLHYRL